uniref:hypothetical protein n=1 Tax=Natronococcus wangiae TaxID=3068275 RepID=UPI00273F8947|nr:hypothetical protein [Natronococcus sp. AD5]
MSYTLSKRVDGEFDDVVEETIDELKNAGFGVLCDIDVDKSQMDGHEDRSSPCDEE